jgi:glycosyltransferase involved in cell wall biosynthesis
MMPTAKAILLHDFFEIRGGGERLAMLLCKELGLDICFGFWRDTSYDRQFLDDVNAHDLGVHTNIMGWRTIRHIHAFEHKTGFLSGYDRALYSGVVAPLAVRNKPNGPNIFYCHTPPRFVYDKQGFYLARIPAWQRPVLRGLIAYLRPRYEEAVDQMDTIIANSENVSRRIHRYLGKPSTVIHPPCDVEGFRWAGQGDYYLSTARLSALKRVDLIVQAFARMPGKKLIVASGGEEFQRLQAMARGAENILFTGWLDDARLAALVGNCIATLYVPRDEDFGMSPVESMAAGKPVIGVAEGGLLETVVDGETGRLLAPNPATQDLMAAVETLTPADAMQMRGACEARAQAFRQEIFLERMRAVVT